MLLSSHDLDEVERLCTDVTVLRHGSVVYSGGIHSLRAPGGRRVWRLQTSDNDLALLVDHPAVMIEPGSGGALQVAASQSDFDDLLLTLASRRVVVRELSREELSFENLYFQLTGDSVASAAEEPAWP